MTDQPKNLEKGSGYFARDPEIARAAQLKGAEARKRNTKFREVIQEILKLNAPEKIQQTIKQFFPEIEGKLNNQQAMALRMILEAQRGKSTPFKLVTDIVDGLPKQNIKMEGDLTFHKKLEDLEKATDEKTINKIKKALEDNDL